MSETKSSKDILTPLIPPLPLDSAGVGSNDDKDRVDKDGGKKMDDNQHNNDDEDNIMSTARTDKDMSMMERSEGGEYGSFAQNDPSSPRTPAKANLMRIVNFLPSSPKSPSKMAMSMPATMTLSPSSQRDADSYIGPTIPTITTKRKKGKSTRRSSSSRMRHSFDGVGSSRPSTASRGSPVLEMMFSQQPRSFSDSFTNESSRRKVKSTLYTILNPRSQQWMAERFRMFITFVILVDFVFFCISTEPEYKDEGREIFKRVEGIASSIFLWEYIGRLCTITEQKRYEDMGPVWGRLRFMATIPSIVDLLATAPFFLELITGWDLPTLTFLRTFRLFRILKTNGFVRATDALWRVLYYNRQIMYMSVFIGLFIVLCTSILMYYLRPRNGYTSHEFDSIPSTMYLAAVMLTGQGGPEGNLPWYTKAGVLITGAFSIGMFAIPVSMLTWGFEAEAARCAKRTRQLEKRKVQQLLKRKNSTGASPNNGDDDDDDVSTDEYSTDEEYKKIIAGEESDSNDEEDDDVKEALRLFRKADRDGSGSISLHEFLETVQLHRNIRTADEEEEEAAKEEERRQAQMLADRLSALESKVDDIVEKVSRLCDELAPPKTITWSSDTY